MSPRMKDTQILSELEAISNNLGIDIRYEKGDFEGGLCKINAKDVIIVNKTLTIQQKIRVLARELNSFDLEGIYIIPALRRIIDEHQNNEPGPVNIEILGDVNERNRTS